MSVSTGSSTAVSGLSITWGFLGGWDSLAAAPMRSRFFWASTRMRSGSACSLPAILRVALVPHELGH